MIVINDQPTALKPYSIGELASIYQVDYRTLKKWIKPFESLLGERIGRYYSVSQVRIIFHHLNIPSLVVSKPIGGNDNHPKGT